MADSRPSGVPAASLHKAGPLPDAEMGQVRPHPVIGERILARRRLELVHLLRVCFLLFENAHHKRQLPLQAVVTNVQNREAGLLHDLAA